MPKPEADLLDRTRFVGLIRRWAEDTEHISSTTRTGEHPACREIIAMGDAVVPLLLGEIDDHPTILGLIALREITGINPSPPEARGDIARMAEAWLAWGREHEYQSRLRVAPESPRLAQ